MIFQRHSVLLPALLTVSIAVTGCFNNKIKMEDITGGINFSILEYHEYQNAEPIPAIALYTNNATGCGNNLIYNRVTLGSHELIIDIEGYSNDGSCVGSSSPATAVIPFFLANGDYDLTINYESESDSYSFIITDSTIALSQSQPHAFSKMNYDYYWRFPRNSFAVYVGLKSGADSLYTQLFDSLSTNFNIQEFTIPDTGEKAYPDSLIGYELIYPARFFKYISSLDMQSAGQFLEDFGNRQFQNPVENRFVLFDWKYVIFSTTSI